MAMIPHILINIDVPDVPAAERFYVEAFGLVPARRFGPHAVEMTGAGCNVYLLGKKAGSAPYPNAAQPRSYDRHWSPIHLDFVVDDVEAARDRAIAAGATLEADVIDHAWGRIAYFADPFGHGFCLLQFSERGYDAIATR